MDQSDKYEEKDKIIGIYIDLCKVHEKQYFVVHVTCLIYLGERVLFEMVPFNCCLALSAFSLITTLSEGSKLGS